MRIIFSIHYLCIRELAKPNWRRVAKRIPQSAMNKLATQGKRREIPERIYMTKMFEGNQCNAVSLQEREGRNDFLNFEF